MKAIVDKIEDVAEGLRGEYAAGEGGKFYLKLEGLEAGNGSNHPAVAEVLRAKQHSNSELQTVKQELQDAKKATKDAQDACYRYLLQVLPA